MIGILVLHQIPTPIEAAGILLVAGGVALHKEAETRPSHRTKSTGDRMVEPEHLEVVSSVHTD
jgi:hypothetical protein